MYKNVIPFALLCAFIAYVRANNVEASNEDAINWGKVDIACTLKCAKYWTCFAQNFLNQESCEEPKGCECNQFADDDEKKFDFKKALDKLDRVVGKAQKVIDIYNEIKSINNAEVAETDSDEFLVNWKKVNPGCTIKCASYWTCFAQNFSDPSKCTEPSGCECNKFADDDELKFRDVLKKLDKAVGTYNNVRGIFGEEDELRFKNVLGKIKGVVGAYTKIRPFLEEDEKVNWRKIIGKIDKAVGTYGKVRDIFSEEDEKIRLGKLIGKVDKAINKYQQIRGLFGEEDEKFNFKKFIGKVDKAVGKYQKIRGIFGEEDEKLLPTFAYENFPFKKWGKKGKKGTIGRPLPWKKSCIRTRKVAQNALKAVLAAKEAGIVDENNDEFTLRDIIRLTKAVEADGDEFKIKKILKGAKKAAKIASKVNKLAGTAALFLEEEDEKINFGAISKYANKAMNLFKTFRRD